MLDRFCDWPNDLGSCRLTTWSPYGGTVSYEFLWTMAGGLETIKHHKEAGEWLANQAKFYGWLMIWKMNFMTFHILGIVTPRDFHIFQRGWHHQPVGNWTNKKHPKN